MSSRNYKVFPELDRPPIAEAVCGVVFEPVPDLDALVLVGGADDLEGLVRAALEAS